MAAENSCVAAEYFESSIGDDVGLASVLCDGSAAQQIAHGRCVNDGAGPEAVGSDPKWPQLFRPGQRAQAHTELRQRVGEVRSEVFGAKVEWGRQRQDVRVLRAGQMRDAFLTAQVRAAHVDLLHQVEALHRRVHRSCQEDGASVVDQHVDATKVGNGRRDRSFDLSLVAHVTEQRNGASSGRFDFGASAVESPG